MRRRRVAVLALVATLGLAALAGALVGSGAPRADPLVVRVRATGCGPVPATALGFTVDGSRIATVAHHVLGATSIAVEVEGVWHPASPVAVDPVADLAVVRIDGPAPEGLLGRPPVRLGTAGSGDEIVVAAVDEQGTAGRVHRAVGVRGPDLGAGTARRDALELDVAVDEGRSGAPVLDRRGAVVGVVFAASRRNPGRSWAVAADVLGPLLTGDEAGTDRARLPCVV